MSSKKKAQKAQKIVLTKEVPHPHKNGTMIPAGTGGVIVMCFDGYILALLSVTDGQSHPESVNVDLSDGYEQQLSA